MADPIALEIVKTVGSIAGFAAFAWKIFDEFRLFLRFSLTARIADDWLLIETGVKNQGKLAKIISNALLVIGPEDEGPVETVVHLRRTYQALPEVVHTDDFGALTVDAIDDERAILILPFYFDESVDIADEELGYIKPIALANFQKGKPYSVRFFIFGPRRLHRSTQTCFVVPNEAPAAA